jgi:tRNA pseudouridine38-40 synthase
MARYKITIEYEGTDLVGWQKQPGQNSVQQILEDAIFGLSQERVETVASGRTDAGVHALGQVVSFDMVKQIENLRQGINFHMQNKPVVVVAAEKVSDDFNARFSAKKRYYRYTILNRSSVPVIDKNRVWHIAQPLDIRLMKKAAKHLKGNHDFTSFRASECQAKSPVKTLDKIKIERDGDYVHMYFSALSFLHHMVRNMAGTLAQVGYGKIAPDEVKNILAAKDRTKAGVQAPACGLYFIKVDY